MNVKTLICIFKEFLLRISLKSKISKIIVSPMFLDALSKNKKSSNSVLFV